MPRPKRIQYPNAVYHVMSRGNERRPIFLDDTDRKIFLRILRESLEETKVVCHAWVLMENHYHLLLETPCANLSAMMQRLNGAYTEKFNYQHDRIGHLFQGRYKSIVVDKDVYLKGLCRYIVLNPVRAGLVEHPADYPWCSYGETMRDAKVVVVVDKSWLLAQFGKNFKAARKGYRTFIESGIRAHEKPFDRVKAKVYLGDEKFLEKMEACVKGQVSPEIPKYQRNILRPAPDAILGRVADEFNTTVDQILKTRARANLARDIAAYLLKTESGLSFRETGALLAVTGSAISNRVSRMKQRLGRDSVLARRILKCKV